MDEKTIPPIDNTQVTDASHWQPSVIDRLELAGPSYEIVGSAPPAISSADALDVPIIVPPSPLPPI